MFAGNHSYVKSLGNVTGQALTPQLSAVIPGPGSMGGGGQTMNTQKPVKGKWWEEEGRTAID